MPIDHSITYEEKSLRTLPHRKRLKAIVELLDSCDLSPKTKYADFGCSNGYITSMIAARYSIERAVGFDCEPEHIDKAKEKHAGLEFELCNLNDATAAGQFDLVTCFETLEHVGNPENGLRKLIASCSQGGRIIVTVPIETGLTGLAKFFAKRFVYASRYRKEFAEIFDKKPVIRYVCALAVNAELTSFRDARSRWATHFGFDSRIIDKFLKSKHLPYKTWRAGTTRLYLITNKPLPDLEQAKKCNHR